MKESGQEDKMDGNSTQQQQVRDKTFQGYLTGRDASLKNRKSISISTLSLFTIPSFGMHLPLLSLANGFLCLTDCCRFGEKRIK